MAPASPLTRVKRLQVFPLSAAFTRQWLRLIVVAGIFFVLRMGLGLNLPIAVFGSCLARWFVVTPTPGKSAPLGFKRKHNAAVKMT